MSKQKLTRDEFLKITKGNKHHNEDHDAYGATLYWKINGKIYVEWQPDVGSCEWWIER